MKKRFSPLTLLLAALFVSHSLFCGPLDVRKFTLKNGLTVYLNEDHSKPEIYGSVVVKAGSRNDPEDATGIAHYFEHIMFKGTDLIGTINWKAEKLYLDSISMLYDKLFLTTEEDKRTDIQREINRLSLKAAAFAIPNEVADMLRDIGSEGLNASTSFEQTRYYNSFPANQLEKWMDIYVERFRNPVFRLFQSELETVYEEKNLYSDRPVQAMIEDFLQTFYKDHPFSKPVIGTTEHLKNPRLSKMMEFYQTWYVANNMALILSGDFKSDDIIPMIEEKFGILRSAPLPELTRNELASFKGREFKQVRLTPIQIGLMGFRTVEASHADQLAFEIASKLLINSGGTGILNKLVMDNKLMTIQAIPLQASDHGSYIVLFMPKVIGQSFSSAETLVNEGLSKLRRGEFSDELLQAVKLEFRKEAMRELETTSSRTNILTELFITGKQWHDHLKDIERAEEISKEDVMRIANTYLGSDHLVYQSKMGFPKKDKLQKPDWKPVLPQNTEKKSEFNQLLSAKGTPFLAPKFIRFGQDVRFEPLAPGYELYYTQNPYNEIFTLTIDINAGEFKDRLLPSVAGYMNLVGTVEKPFLKFRQELQNLGSTLSFTSGENNFTISIEGFEHNLAPTLKLLNEILTQPAKDDKQLQKFVQSIQANNRTRRNDPAAIADGLNQFALFGENAASRRNITLAEAKKLESNQLLAAFKGVLKYNANLLYTGNTLLADLRKILMENLTFNQSPLKGEFFEPALNSFDSKTIYVHKNPKARQSNLYFYVKANSLSEDEKVLAYAFNEYFGGSMSSLVFQEIREFRSLAYTARATMRIPFHMENPAYLTGYINTQSDKTIDAIDAMSNLILNMPQKPDRMQSILNDLLQSIHTSQPGFRQLNTTVARWRMQGYESDPREHRYALYKNLTFDDIVNFYSKQIKDKPLQISVSGNLPEKDRNKLSAYGRVVEMKFDQFIKE